jgi:PAS domain S-box-containing protein
MNDEVAARTDLEAEISRLRARVAELEEQTRHREAAEAALAESEEKFLSTMDAALVGMYVIQDLRFVYVNGTMADLFGYRVDEIENRLGPTDLVVPEQRERVANNLRRRAVGEVGTPYEIECVRKDGSRFDAMVWGKGFTLRGRPASVGSLVDISGRKDAQRELLRQRQELEAEVVAQTAALREANRHLEQDIAERQQIEAELRASEERFRALIDATVEDIVVLLDDSLRMVIVNERMTQGFGKTVEAMLGKRMGDLMPAPVAAHREEMARRVLSDGRPVRFEDQRGGHWFDNNMCPVIGPSGRPEGVAIFARDITRRKAMEEALAEAKEQAEKANAAKSRFLAAANHDLRQPLQAMSLLVGALSYARIDEQARTIARDMQETLTAMEGLLNALLDISKLDAGIVIPKDQDFLASVFLHQLRNQFKALAAERGVTIRLFCRNDPLHTDPDLLERILHNLVSNAIRHTRHGRILIGSRRRGERLRIEVWDRGEGIAAADLGRIFEEFQQVGNPERSPQQGLGLGLAIAKRIAALLGLRLDVRSEVGRGSVFFVEVPLASSALAVKPEDPPAEIALPARDTTVLVVEDDSQVLLATARLLRLWGYRPICARSGEEALDLLSDKDLRPGIALVDYRLPGTRTGVQLLDEMSLRLGLDIPSLLLTADTAPERLREAQTSGYPILHKPVTPTALRQALAEHAPTRPQAPGSATAGGKASLAVGRGADAGPTDQSMRDQGASDAATDPHRQG